MFRTVTIRSIIHKMLLSITHTFIIIVKNVMFSKIAGKASVDVTTFKATTGTGLAGLLGEVSATGAIAFVIHELEGLTAGFADLAIVA